VATHGVRYGASAALAIEKLCSGHELRYLEPSFSDTDRLEDQEAIAVIIHAKDVVNNVFLGP
jgi:hypothetical protein